MIVFNGVTGGIGRYLLTYCQENSIPFRVIRSRLDDIVGMQNELNEILVEDEDRAPTLIHLAGLVSVRRCESEPDRAYRVNVCGARELTKVFIHWCRCRKTKSRVIYISTGHVYAASDRRGLICESHEVEPRSEYAKTKLMAEHEVVKLAEMEEVTYVILRLFGLIAPSQSPEFVLPGLLRRAQVKDFSNIPGLECVRDYLDSRDVSRILIALSRTDTSGIYNLCSSQAVTIRELLNKIICAMYGETTGNLLQRTTAGADRSDSVPYLVGDNKEIQGILSVPIQRITISETVSEAVAISNEK